MFSFFGRRKKATEEPADDEASHPNDSLGSSLDRIYQAGERIGGRYKVLDSLEGGLGRIYVVTNGDDPIVLKTPKFIGSQSAKADFISEANIWVGLGRHPNIVSALWVDEIVGLVFVAAEYVAPDELDCITLRDILDVGQPTLSQIVRWGAEFCYGLEHALAKGLVAHRDIKPANLLVGAQGRLRITDFGISATLPDRQSSAKVAEPQIAGTPLYMSPEQIRGAAQDVRTDIYAFGVVLHEMCFGRHPWHSNELDALFAEHLNRVPEIPNHPLKPVIARCLSKSRSDRFKSPKELLSAITSVANSGGIPIPPRPGQAETESDAPALLARVMLLEVEGKPRQAVEAARQLVTRWPHFPAGWTELGRVCLAVGDVEQAEHALRKSLHLDPTRSAPWNNLGLVLTEKAKYGEAVEAFERALDADPANTGAIANMAGPLRKLGRHLEAISLLEGAIKRAPDKYNLVVNLSGIQHAIGQYRTALETLDKAIALAPEREKRRLLESRAALANKNDVGDGAEKLLLEGNLAKAIPLLLARAEASPNHAANWQNLALAYYEAGNKSEAQDAFRRVARIEPANTVAILRLVRLATMSQDKSEALRWIDVYSRLPHHGGKAEAIRAYVLDELGEYAEARRIVLDATKHFPEEPDVHVAYGDLAVRHGAPSYAIPAYKYAIQLMIQRSDPIASRRRIEASLTAAEQDAATRTVSSVPPSFDNSLIRPEELLHGINRYGPEAERLLQITKEEAVRRTADGDGGAFPLDRLIRSLRDARSDPKASYYAKFTKDEEGEIFASHGWAFDFFANVSGREIKGLEALRFSHTKDGTLSAYFVSVVLPTIGVFWHGLYGRDYQLIESPGALNEVVSGNKLKKTGRDIHSILNTAPGLRIRDAGGHRICECLHFSKTEGLLDIKFDISADGRASEPVHTVLLEPAGMTLY